MEASKKKISSLVIPRPLIRSSTDPKKTLEYIVLCNNIIFWLPASRHRARYRYIGTVGWFRLAVGSRRRRRLVAAVGCRWRVGHGIVVAAVEVVVVGQTRTPPPLPAVRDAVTAFAVLVADQSLILVVSVRFDLKHRYVYRTQSIDGRARYPQPVSVRFNFRRGTRVELNYERGEGIDFDKSAVIYLLGFHIDTILLCSYRVQRLSLVHYKDYDNYKLFRYCPTSYQQMIL